MVTEEDDPKSALRSAFRVNDKVVIFHRKATTEDIQNPKAANIFTSEHFVLQENLKALNEQSHEALSKLAKTNSQLAEYLNLIDIKVNLLAEAVMYPKEALHQQKQLVNLSETGIGFGCKTQYEKNDIVCVKFTLFPTFISITAIGQVIRSANSKDEKISDPNFPFWTALHFTDISEIEQQWLVRHLLQLQAKELKAKREQG